MKKISLLLFLTLSLTAGFAQIENPGPRMYNIIIKGGHVIDPKNNIDEVMDVAITRGRPAQAARPATPARPGANGQPGRPAQPAQPASPAIEGKVALVAKNIDPNLGSLVVDAKGMYVTPGLVDLHEHVFPGAGRGDLDPDVVTFRAGVTTAVDAGSSGWKSFPQFKRETIDKAETRVLAFLNIGGQGYWRDETGRGYESDTSLYNVKEAAETAMKYKDIIVGIKAAHFGGPLYMIAVDRGIAAGKIANIPFMLDGTMNEAVLNKFRPGDIFTHMYGRVLVDTTTNKVQQFVIDARKRGVLFDIGFGAASIGFRQALPAFKEGFLPNTLGTDLNYHSYNGSMKNILNVMSTVLAMGMTLPEIIKASTWMPAQAIKHTELGHLSVGAGADVTILSIRPGNFGFWDKDGYKIMGKQRFECELTIRGGNIVYDANGIGVPLPKNPIKL
jgi:dihydroorotase